MATITLEVPDDLVAKIPADAFPALLRELVAAKAVKLSTLTNGNTTPIYRELLDFLASNPAREQVIAYKISPVAQDRLEDLLYRNREETLTPAERAELDTYLSLSDWITLLKARARSGQPLL